MGANLRDKGQFLRFFSVSLIGTVADYALAVGLEVKLGLAYVLSAALGFMLGSLINYGGHTIFSFSHTKRSDLSVIGYAKYLGAVAASLVVRLVVVAMLGRLSTLAFWFIMLCAIGASFVTSYLISALWVFRKPG